MASAEPIPFGLRHPTPEQVGILARRLLEEADDAIRRARPRALLLVVPFLVFYMLYAGFLGLVLWGLGIRLDPPLFLALNAAVFAFMAVLGRYYRGGEMEVEADMPRVLAVMVLQATILRAFTWFFFVIPYLAFRNLARLFPRRARVSPQALEVAVQVGVALDAAVTARQLTTLLPRPMGGRALAEALILLEWAGVAATHPRGGDVVVHPGPMAGGLTASLPERVETVALSMILEAPRTAQESEGEPEPDPLPVPRWLRPLADRPGRAAAMLIGGGVGLWILLSLGLGWYRRLPVTLENAALPHLSEAGGLAYGSGWYAVCGDGTVDLYRDLSSAPEESYGLTGLVRTDIRLRRRDAPNSPGREEDFGNETAWDVPEEREVRVSFGPVYWALPDPGGRYLLLYGDWKCMPDSGASCGRLGLGVVDLEAWTFTPEERFSGWSLKGWWEEGTLLAVNPSLTWDQGGGQGPQSANLAGTMAALDPHSGERVELRRPREAYFGWAGMEDGKRVFLSAEWKRSETRPRARCTLTEYREFQPVRRFTLPLKLTRPFLYQARLDPTGRYWVLAFGDPPGLMEFDKGIQYSLWVATRSGGRQVRVMESRGKMPYLITSLPYRGGALFGMLTGDAPPHFSVHEIVR